METESNLDSAAETPDVATTATPLNANDRCDSCGAQAYVRATLTFGELLFCLHHATLNKAALDPSIVHWQDESDKLLVR